MNPTRRRLAVAPWSIDAPKIIQLNLALAVLMLIVQIVVGPLPIGSLRIVLWVPILFCAVPACAMLAYSIWGEAKALRPAA
ncbi:MAG: hypothetical protein ACRYGI_12130 [Janthinobacterium lividum]